MATTFSQAVRQIYKEHRKNSSILDPVTFAESASGLNIKLYPVQRFILKVFYSLPLESQLPSGEEIVIRDEFNEHPLYTFTSEIDFFNFLYEQKRINLSYDEWSESDDSLLEVVFVCGRRASKTTLTSIITIHQIYTLLTIDDPHRYFNILSSDPITISLVSNNQDGAVRTFKSISNIILGSRYFERYVMSSTREELWLASEAWKERKEAGGEQITAGNILVKSFAAGPGVRGTSNIVTIIDEIDHFRDASSRQYSPELASKVYEALAPSILGFVHPDTKKAAGKSFIMSSPNGKRGYLYKLYEESFGGKTRLMLHMPTNWINTNVASEFLKEIYHKSENSFRQEIRAEFVDPISNWISDPNRLLACFNELAPNTPKQELQTKHYMGIDLAFNSDRTVIAIGHIQDFRPEYKGSKPEYDNLIAKDGNYYVIDYIEIIKPEQYAESGESKGAISVFDVINKIKDLSIRFDIKAGTFDQFSGDVFNELTKKEGLHFLSQEPANQTNNSDRANTMKSLIVEGRLLMPSIPDVIDEFMGLQEEVLRNGLVKVENTRFHDDSYTAVSRVVELCFRYKEIVASKYVAGVKGNSTLARPLARPHVSMSGRRSSFSSGSRVGSVGGRSTSMRSRF